MSGFPTGRFYFQGFLPQKKGRNSLLKELSRIKMPILIFESPFRVRKTLLEIAEIFGNRDASLSRELTKKFEQTIRGRLKDIASQRFPDKGEFVLIINNN
jgi:16S rRNA (cytidine1402-2'-O)-methyltransferase